MKPTFYTKLPILYNIVLGIIFTISLVITIGLSLCLYDFFVHHKYWLNRRILYKYLKTKDIKYTSSLLPGTLNSIVEYKFENFTIWKYTKQLELCLFTETDKL